LGERGWQNLGRILKTERGEALGKFIDNANWETNGKVYRKKVSGCLSK